MSIDIQEEMVELYHSVDSTLAGVERKILMLVSSQEEEGTTTICEQFAKTATQVFGKSVMLLKTGDLERKAEDGDGGAEGGETAEESVRAGEEEGTDGGGVDERTGESRGAGSTGDSLAENAFSAEERYLIETQQGHYGAKGMQKTSLRPLHLETHEDGYQVVAFDQVGTSLSKAFSSPNISNILSYLKERYEIILLDAPALSATSDGLASIRKVDGVILVVEAERTRWQQAANSAGKIRKLGGNLLGVVLNKQKHHIPAALYNRL